MTIIRIFGRFVEIKNHELEILPRELRGMVTNFFSRIGKFANKETRELGGMTVILNHVIDSICSLEL